MTRLPRNGSACLSLGTAGALLLGLAISPYSALAEDLTPEHIKADIGGRQRIDQGQYGDLQTGRPSVSTTRRRVSASSTRSTPTTSKTSGWCGATVSIRPAASRRRRSWSTASCIRPRPWSVVHAIDARRERRLWTYDPGVNREHGLQGLLRRRQSRRRCSTRARSSSPPMTDG